MHKQDKNMHRKRGCAYILDRDMHSIALAQILDTVLNRNRQGYF